MTRVLTVARAEILPRVEGQPVVVEMEFVEDDAEVARIEFTESDAKEFLSDLVQHVGD
jgi:hypothetical protein